MASTSKNLGVHTEIFGHIYQCELIG